MNIDKSIRKANVRLDNPHGLAAGVELMMAWRSSAMIYVAIVCLLLAGAGRLHAEEPDLNALLAQLIEQYGGEENLRKLDNHIQEWDVVALIGARHGTDTRRIRVPDQLKVDITYPDKQESRIVNGESGYFIYRDTLPLKPEFGSGAGEGGARSSNG